MIKKRPSISKRQRQALATKDALMQTAISLFAQYGFERVTIEDITSNAGTSKGAFYHHFKSKNDVVLERFKDMDQANQIFYKNAMRKREPREQILAYMGQVTDFTVAEFGLDFTKILYMNEIQSLDSKIFVDTTRPIYSLLDDIVKKAQQNGYLRTDRTSQQIVLYFIRLLRMVTYEWCCREGGFDLTSETKRVLTDSYELMTI